MEDIYKKEKQEIIHLEKLNLIWDVRELKWALKMGLFSLKKNKKYNFTFHEMRNWNTQPEGVRNWKTGESETVCLWLLDHAGVFWDGGVEHLQPLAALAINFLKTT